MKAQINGEDTDIKNNMTVSELLNELEIDKKAVAVELNLTVMKKSEYDNTFIKENDKIEIVHFVGGG